MVGVGTAVGALEVDATTVAPGTSDGALTEAGMVDGEVLEKRKEPDRMDGPVMGKGAADIDCVSESGLALAGMVPEASVGAATKVELDLPGGAVSEPPAHGPGAVTVTVEVDAPYNVGGMLEAAMACAMCPGAMAMEPAPGATVMEPTPGATAMEPAPGATAMEPASEGAMVIFQDHTVPVSLPIGPVAELTIVVVIGSARDIPRGDRIGEPGRGDIGEPTLGN